MSRLVVALIAVLAIPSAWANGDLETIHSIQRQVAALIHQGRSMASLRGGQNQLTAECWRTMKAHQAKAKELREQNNPISPRLLLGASVDLDSAIVKVESCVSCLPNAKSYCDAAQKYLKASEKDIAQSKQPLPKGPVDVKLPPVSKRKIIGTWFVNWGTSPLTRSIEKIHSKYYMVMRFTDHTGGDTGEQLARIKPHTFRPIPPDSSGDYFVIKKDGTLALMDDEGLIAVLPKHGSLWPMDESSEANASKKAEPVSNIVSNGDSAVVTKAEFGSKWPLKVNQATIECREHSRIVIKANGKTYWFNGLAKGAAKSQGWSDLRNIWLDDPSWGIPGAKKNIGPLNNAATKLCPYTGY